MDYIKSAQFSSNCAQPCIRYTPVFSDSVSVAAFAMCDFAYFMHIMQYSYLVLGFRRTPLFAHFSCLERRPHSSQKFFLLPAMISVHRPPPPPPPTGAPTLTATASFTSSPARIATWRSRGLSIRMYRQVEPARRRRRRLAAMSTIC